jgi:hypothetical protein
VSQAVIMSDVAVVGLAIDPPCGQRDLRARLSVYAKEAVEVSGAIFYYRSFPNECGIRLSTG